MFQIILHILQIIRLLIELSNLYFILNTPAKLKNFAVIQYDSRRIFLFNLRLIII